MRTQNQTAIARSAAPGPISTLFGRVRQKRRRSRNLAELGRLDSGRLEDIGLSEARRVEIVSCG